MEGAEVRSQILKEHAELRGMLDEVDTLARRFEKGEEGTGPALRDKGLRLYARFASHLDLEDRYLAPALRETGERGARWADRLGHEHHEQRELLRYLLARLAERATPTLLISRELANFVEYLRHDMAHEEETMLDASVLGAEAGADG